MQYSVRELQDVDIWRILSVGHDIGDMLAVPSRYRAESVDADWYQLYSGNYGNAVRLVITDEYHNIYGTASFLDVDFYNETAVFRLVIWNQADDENMLKTVRELLAMAFQKLGMKELSCSSEIKLYISGKKTSVNIINHSRKLSEWVDADDISTMSLNKSAGILFRNYCIAPVCMPLEKKYLLRFFDKDMFCPLSRNPDCSGITARIVAGADMLTAYNRRILGFCAFYANDADCKEAYISTIAVKQESRGRGIGKELLITCMRIAKCRGMTRMSLEVNDKNSGAACFYQQMGFTYTNIRNGSNLRMSRIL